MPGRLESVAQPVGAGVPARGGGAIMTGGRASLGWKVATLGPRPRGRGNCSILESAMARRVRSEKLEPI